MIGQASWLTLVLLLLGGGGIALLAIAGQRIATTVRAVVNRGKCPALGTDVDRLILADRIDGHWTNVEKCSAFADPERVTCAKACLKEHDERRLV